MRRPSSVIHSLVLGCVPSGNSDVCSIIENLGSVLSRSSSCATAVFAGHIAPSLFKQLAGVAVPFQCFHALSQVPRTLSRDQDYSPILGPSLATTTNTYISFLEA